MKSFFRDVYKRQVDWQPNYDESLAEPTALPARFPNLLVNGSQGIAVMSIVCGNLFGGGIFLYFEIILPLDEIGDTFMLFRYSVRYVDFIFYPVSIFFVSQLLHVLGIIRIVVDLSLIHI